MEQKLSTTSQQNKLLKKQKKLKNTKNRKPSTVHDTEVTAKLTDTPQRNETKGSSARKNRRANCNEPNQNDANNSVITVENLNNSANSGPKNSMAPPTSAYNENLTPLVNCCQNLDCYLKVAAAAAAAATKTSSPVRGTPQTSSHITPLTNFIANISNWSAANADINSVGANRQLLSSLSNSCATYCSHQQYQQQENENEKPNIRENTPNSEQHPKNSKRNQLYFPRFWHFSSFEEKFMIKLQIDMFYWLLFLLALCTRFYKLSLPQNIVFDELYYGKFIALYMQNIFFFDQHPPLGKQIIAAVANGIGYDGNFTATHIGSPYVTNVPLVWLRFVPALCGSLLPGTIYNILIEVGLTRWSAILGGLLVIFDNALLTQSRFVLMESQLLLFCMIGLHLLIKFRKTHFAQPSWVAYGVASACLLTCAICVKYIGFLSYCLAGYLLIKYMWDLLYDATISNFYICLQAVVQFVIFMILPICLYLFIFYMHLYTLYRAGPHDSIMTSAFQASLEGGLASVTKGQPLNIAHGSQITLRHSHGRTCWLHSHAHVYPIRYPDNRGSSFQQQVTCYSFKDVNNWWIVKRPNRNDLVVGNEPDVIRDGDIIQLVHGITSRALNSHDVASAMTPQCQEVSCYIDYKIQMKGEILWRVLILNKATEGSTWHAIKSEVRLIHVATDAALSYTGRQLPDWGFHQHEVAGDRNIDHKNTIWNAEEHRYTKIQDEREREQLLLKAEMLPSASTKLSSFQKFCELQVKMLWHPQQVHSHMYSSEPLDWPLLSKTIAYWIDGKTNSQIHLLGNLVIWYSGTLSIIFYIVLGIFYILRRSRLYYDIDIEEWQRFLNVGHIFLIGYLLHYLPYFFTDNVLFLHNYLPAFLYKLQLLCYVIEHLDYLFRKYCSKSSRIWLLCSYRMAVVAWFLAILVVYIKFLPITYGLQNLTTDEITNLRWKSTWQFLL